VAMTITIIMIIAMSIIMRKLHIAMVKKRKSMDIVMEMEVLKKL